MATFSQKRLLLKGLLSGELACTGPFHAMIDLTQRCNLHCIGCRFHSPMACRPSPSDPNIQDMPWDLFEKTCRQLHDAGTRVIFLMGEGEPLLHPEIFGMIAFAKEFGFRVTIISNGTLLNETVAQKLISAPTDGFQVSLWALTETDYDAQYPGTDPENFHKVLRGLSRLSLEKQKRNSRLPRVVLHHPINRRNVQRIDAITDVAAQAGCDGISLSPFLSQPGIDETMFLSREEERQLVLRLGTLKHRLHLRGLTENIDTVIKRYSFVPLRQRTSACYVGWFHTRVRVDGTVVPCGACDIVVGHLRRQSFEEIWNGSVYRRFRRQMRTYEGLRNLSGRKCNCGYCCYAQDNLRIERRVGTWLTLWLKMNGRSAEPFGRHPDPFER